jgi:phage host-nuclease inhibitor protein Gam
MATKNLGRVKAKAQKLVAQSIDEVTEMVRDLGKANRESTRLNLAMQEEIAEITQKYQGPISAEKAKIGPIQVAVQAYCEANRSDLTQANKTKTIELISGKVFWRMPPPSVALKGVDSIVAFLSKGKLRRFLRTKVEIDKDALLKEPKIAAAITGVTIKEGEEDFVIEPLETTV